MKKEIMKNKAFSLVELLVVVAILGGLSVAVSRVFFSNLKGTDKTQRILELRQAGDGAMLRMKKKIKNARKVITDCPSGGFSSSQLQIEDAPEGGYTVSERTETIFSCNSQGLFMEEVGGGGSTALTPVTLYIADCNTVFTCEKPVGASARVSIDFTLTNDEGESQEFSSSVSLRNFQ